MPSSVLEAFASGCPVVATHAGGVPAILTDGVHGLLVPCGDAERTAEAVCRVIDDPVLASELAGSARESCEQYAGRRRAQWVSRTAACCGQIGSRRRPNESRL
jgi:glycosyltransferase involved in cell wall biosynthesis